MDKDEFKKLLFKVAFCTMACDGHIDDREVEEMKIMDKSTSYFESIDLSEELEILLADLGSKGIKVIDELFTTLRETKLNIIQELLVLEVALRIIYADEKYDDNEIHFLKFLRSKLELHDETIVDRFGVIDILKTSDYIQNYKIEDSDEKIIARIKLPDLEELKEIKLK
ncbi:MAG: TerB family tellurite resistance protein [Melioribacteraceae bacterium]|nr:TerB family tellurite resistance protein [Melioribacteraceae bacterium]